MPQQPLGQVELPDFAPLSIYADTDTRTIHVESQDGIVNAMSYARLSQNVVGRGGKITWMSDKHKEVAFTLIGVEEEPVLAPPSVPTQPAQPHITPPSFSAPISNATAPIVAFDEPSFSGITTSGTQRVTKIDPMSLAKSGAICGIVIGIVLMLIAIVSAVPKGASGIGAGFLMGFILLVAAAVGSFVSGLLGAVIYNTMIVKFTGGIKITFSN